MNRFLIVTALLMINAVASAGEQAIPMFPRVEIVTTEGAFVVELDGRRAPVSVHNFVKYVQDGFYDGTVFHRVIPGFMAQAGGFGENLKEKPTRAPIPNESGNGLSNRRGTIAMARTGDPHSATAQFYINLADNKNLDPNPSRWGYTVFGEVVAGLSVLDKIAEIPTGPAGPFRSDVPSKTIQIKSARLIKDAPPET